MTSIPVPFSGKVPVSVIIPTLNEAKNLPRCLDHLGWADEVAIIDSNSKDDTVAIARAYGAGVIDFRWNGQWPKKRNWALQNAPLKHEWILMVDADEWIVPELAAEIGNAIHDPRFVGYWINRRFIFMGRWIKHCGYYPSWNLRLLKRGHGEFEKLTDVGDTGSGDNEVHEHLRPDGPTGYLKHDMLHLAFPTISIFMEKHNRYSNWEAIVQFKGSKEPDPGPLANPDVARRRRLKKLSRRLPFRATLRFLYTYVYHRGFLDGRAGYILCRLLAVYEFLSWAKFHELRHEEDDREVERKLSAVPTFDWKSASRDSSLPSPCNSSTGV
jgi:glycosyltransferase involved in cell wall biosynthesis